MLTFISRSSRQTEACFETGSADKGFRWLGGTFLFNAPVKFSLPPLRGISAFQKFTVCQPSVNKVVGQWMDFEKKKNEKKRGGGEEEAKHAL